MPPRVWIVREWVALVLRLVVGGVWIVAGALKVLEPAQSVAAVRAYQILSLIHI